MSVSEDTGSAKGLVQRVKAILLSPKTEWDVIAAEPATIRGLYTGYVAILAAIPPVCGAIGSLLLGAGLFGASWVIAGAALQYVLSLLSVYVVAVIVEQLAPSFGAAKDRLSAFKLVTYASTASWVAGVFGIVPLLGWLPMLLGGLYSLYLLYLGLPKLMKSPEDKTLPYLAVTVLVAIVVQWVIFAVAGMVVASMTVSRAMMGV